ncbi:MAG: hypothetical protein ACP5T0_06240 [Verrucomicrobiia bacterium]
MAAIDKLLLYCHCANAKILPQSVRDEALRKFCESGVEFLAVSDLCGLCSQKGLDLSAKVSNVRAFACHPRAIKWLLSNIGIQVDEKNDCFDLRSNTVLEFKNRFDAVLQNKASSAENSESANKAVAIPEEHNINYNGVKLLKFKDSDRFSIIKSLLEAGFSVYISGNGKRDCFLFENFSKETMEVILDKIANPGASKCDRGNCITVGSENLNEILDLLKSNQQQARWYPWFPVVDFERCTNCMQCLSFCLFGVFGTDEEGNLRILSPENCKTNCPACARVCPEGAIIFPKHQSDSINGGTSEMISQFSQNIDLSLLLSGDVYDTLRKRSQQTKERFSPEKNKEIAYEERRRCMREFAGIVPPEVLKTLPGKEELQKRAQEASEKARRALDKKNLEK